MYVWYVLLNSTYLLTYLRCYTVHESFLVSFAWTTFPLLVTIVFAIIFYITATLHDVLCSVFGGGRIWTLITRTCWHTRLRNSAHCKDLTSYRLELQGRLFLDTDSGVHAGSANMHYVVESRHVTTSCHASTGVVIIGRFCSTLHSVTPAGHPGPAPSHRPNPRLSP